MGLLVFLPVDVIKSLCDGVSLKYLFFPLDLKCFVCQVFHYWGSRSVYNARSSRGQRLKNNCDFLKFV